MTARHRPAETRLAVMGSDAHVIVVLPAHRTGLHRRVDHRGAGRLLDRARRRLRQLEQRWSRFIADSEVSVLNARAGTPVRVSDDTALLVTVAQRAWQRTGGRFDPMVLPSVIAAGYDADLATLPPDRPAQAPPDRAHDGALTGRIVIDRSAGTVTLPPGGRFDPGGIGKGLAADLVAAELAADRAGELAAADPAGVCVNVGGDVRVHGVGPHPDGWQIGLPDGRVVALRDAAVASSGTDRRAWRVAGARRHHVIDPATGRCAATSLRSTAVVAPVAWLADAHALAALVTGVRPALAALRAAGLDGILVDHDGVVHTTGRLGVGV